MEQLADRPEGFLRADGKAFESLVPLPEVIGASVGYSAASRKVVRQYEEMLRKLGSEFEILRIIPLEEIRSVSGHLITEGIRRLREGKVERIPGFDGEYGTIKLFKQTEIENLDGQMSLFDGMENIRDTKEISGNTGTIQENGLSNEVQENGLSNEAQENGLSNEAQENGLSDEAQKNGLSDEAQENGLSDEAQENGLSNEAQENGRSDNALKSRKGQTISKPVDGPAPQPLNPQQQKAVRSIDRAVAVIAGPGTGKTKTLISRILYLL